MLSPNSRFDEQFDKSFARIEKMQDRATKFAGVFVFFALAWWALIIGGLAFGIYCLYQYASTQGWV